MRHRHGIDAKGGGMKGLQKTSAAFVVAAMVAVGLGTATLEAKKPGGGGGGQAAICSYLESVITYPNVNTTILAFAVSLWNYYGCE
jgi:hypothetical protein